MINSRKLWLHSMIRSQESATAAGTFPQVTPGWQYIGWGKHLPMDIALERPWRLKLDREFPTFILAMVSSWREKWSIRPLHKSLRNTLAPFCHVSVAFFFQHHIKTLLTELLLWFLEVCTRSIFIIATSYKKRHYMTGAILLSNTYKSVRLWPLLTLYKSEQWRNLIARDFTFTFKLMFGLNKL